LKDRNKASRDKARDLKGRWKPQNWNRTNTDLVMEVALMSSEKNNSLKIKMWDLERRSGLNIEMSYCCRLSALSIKFNTPFGVINVSPETVPAPIRGGDTELGLYSFGIDNIAENISDFLKNKLPGKATSGTIAPYFHIIIDAGPNGEAHEDDYYWFSMGLDVVGICDPISTGESKISIALFQNRKNIEEFLSFLQDIKKVVGPDFEE